MVGFLGSPRFTADVDAVFLLSTKDISLGILHFEEEMVERGSIKTFADLSIRLPAPGDLIIMKAIAHRPNDLEDIRTIADKYPDLDRKRIEEWVKSFGEALELPSLWNKIEPLLK